MPEHVRLLDIVNHIIYSRESNPAPGGPTSCSLAPTCPKHTWLEVSRYPAHLVWLVQVCLLEVIPMTSQIICLCLLTFCGFVECNCLLLLLDKAIFIVRMLCILNTQLHNIIYILYNIFRMNFSQNWNGEIN